MDELTLSSQYTAYCILGKVEKEGDKLQYLNQWMKCYELLTGFLSDCPQKSIESDQMFQKTLHYDKNGTARVTHKKAPTGGIQQWNEKNNKKICTLYLEDMLKEKETVEKEGLNYGEWLKQQFPTRDTSVIFFNNTVCGYLATDANIKKYEQMDFLFTLSHSLHVETSKVFNQEINIYISDRLTKTKTEDVIDKLVKNIGDLSFAVKIGKTKMPYQLREYNNGQLSRIDGLVGRSYGFGQSLEFKKNPTNEWTTIFEQ